MKIGIVLSGGMAKGAYQIGALKAIKEIIPSCHIKHISASSIGALNAYAYSANKLEQAEEIWKNTASQGSRAFITKMLRSSYLQQSISDICSENDCFDNDLYITLLNSKKMTVGYHNIRNVNPNLYKDYIKASVAMPIYNYPVQINGSRYYDGALIDNIPIFPFMKLSVDLIICIYFDSYCYKFENEYLDNKILKLTFSKDKFFKESLVFEKDSIDYMISEGYKKTYSILSSVFSSGFDCTETIYQNIEYANAQAGNQKIRITDDLVATNLNKIAQKFTRRKIIK